jgi:hypothetical protein
MSCHLHVFRVLSLGVAFNTHSHNWKSAQLHNRETLKMLQRSLDIKLTKCPWTSPTTIVAWVLGQTCDVLHSHKNDLIHCVLRHINLWLYTWPDLEDSLPRQISYTWIMLYKFSYYIVTMNLASDQIRSFNLKMCTSCDHKFVDNLHCRLAIQHNSRKLMWRFAFKNPAWRKFSRKKRETFVTKFTLLLLKVVVSFQFGWTSVWMALKP